MEQKQYQGWTIIVDADGTLTDGKKHVDIDGDREWISFHSRDSIACRMLIEMGFHIIVLTHSDFPGIRNYWEKYGASFFRPNEGDPMTNKLLVERRYEIDWEKTIGIGDDITDDCFLEKCKFPYLVADAHPIFTIEETINTHEHTKYLPLVSKGGEGVLCEIYKKIKKGWICKERSTK